MRDMEFQAMGLRGKNNKDQCSLVTQAWGWFRTHNSFNESRKSQLPSLSVLCIMLVLATCVYGVLEKLKDFL